MNMVFTAEALPFFSSRGRENIHAGSPVLPVHHAYLAAGIFLGFGVEALAPDDLSVGVRISAVTSMESCAVLVATQMGICKRFARDLGFQFRLIGKVTPACLRALVEVVIHLGMPLESTIPTGCPDKCAVGQS